MLYTRCWYLVVDCYISACLRDKLHVRVHAAICLDAGFLLQIFIACLRCHRLRTFADMIPCCMGWLLTVYKAIASSPGKQ